MVSYKIGAGDLCLLFFLLPEFVYIVVYQIDAYLDV